jgi:hypothetical protein
VIGNFPVGPVQNDLHDGMNRLHCKAAGILP